ncbi:MAG: DUF3097 family protein [Geodermatophilaceae bacterium]
MTRPGLSVRIRVHCEVLRLDRRLSLTGPRSRWPRASRSKASTMPSPWKDGVCARLGGGPDTGAGWKQILGRVNSYADLDPALLGRVEELIDFVAAPG